MITFLAFVAFVVLIISNRSLKSRISAIEATLKGARGVGDIKAQPTNASVSAQPNNVAAPAVNNFPNSYNFPSQTPAEAPNKFANWLKEDWIMKLGAFLFIIGFGWFVSYAFANNWIGPVGRISIGVVAGIIIMAFGYWRMMKYTSQGAVFMALGAGMAMLTIYAGQSIYGFFTPVSAVAFDFIIAAFVSFASYKFNVKSLAFVAQVLAFVTPLLSAGTTDSLFLFSYLLFVSVATLVLAGVTGWRNLITSSLIFVGLYSLPYIFAGGSSYYSSGNMYRTDAPIILYFAYLFSLLYLFAGMFAVVRKGVENTKNEIMLAFLNGLFLFTWIYGVAESEWKVLIFALWAVIFAVSSFIAFRFSSKLDPFYAYGSVAVAFIAAATAEQLSGAALTIAFTVEAFLLVVSVFFLTKNIKATSAASFLFIAPAFLSLESIAKYANSQELFTENFFVLLLLAIALIVAGRLIAHFGKEEHAEKEVNAGSVLIIVGIIYLGYILWQFIHIFMIETPDIATMTTLVIYTIFGLIAYFSGLYGDDMARRVYGTTLLAFVVVRLIIIDVWQMELFGRVITFLAIGALLMGTAFLTKRKKKNG